MKNSHPYDLLDNKASQKLVDKVLLGETSIKELEKHFDKNKFLAQCLVDDELSKTFGFFKLNKKCLKKLINIWIHSGDGLYAPKSIPIIFTKYMDFKSFFLYCAWNSFWLNSNTISYVEIPPKKLNEIKNEYKKYNKRIKINFEKLFREMHKTDFFGDNTGQIIESADFLIEFCEEFNIKTKPVIGHPYDDWHISEYDINYWSEKYNHKNKKRKLLNFSKLFKTWYGSLDSLGYYDLKKEIKSFLKKYKGLSVNEVINKI